MNKIFRTKGKTKGLSAIILILCMLICLTACSKEDAGTSNSNGSNSGITQNNNSDESKSDNTGVSENSNNTANPDNNSEDKAAPTAEPTPEPYFEQVAKKFDQSIANAVAQYENEDYTNLAEPVKYNILWLGYTDVTFDDLEFKMTDFDREYLKAVTLNFEKTVERITNNNVDITIDLNFVSEATPLTQVDYDDWFYLTKETAQSEIDKYDTGMKYDSVITTIQTSGDENVERNTGKDSYGVNYAILGIMDAGIDSGLGYSSFNLGEPFEGTYPLADPEIPSLYATAVAVHEWMHQFESLGRYLGIEFPPTHAYQGNTEGYQKYTADVNNYDYFEFYELVLQGKVPYTGNGNVKHVGMYPSMWPLIKRGVVLNEVGKFKITNLKGEYLYANGDDMSLTVSSEESLWQIYYGGNDRFILISDSYPNLRIDLSNAWDAEDNLVKIYVYTGYDDAQSWRLTQNADGTYCIRTPYSSGRAVTVDSAGINAYISTTDTNPADNQKWIITQVG